MKRALLTSLILLLLPVGVAQAGPVFFDDFNLENGGVGVFNYTGFANFAVSGGTVDLIGNGYYDFLPGNGLYVDLDGSTNQAGLMLAKPIPLAAGYYLLSFDLAGNQRSYPDNTVEFLLFLTSSQFAPFVTITCTVGASQPFKTFTFGFAAVTAGDLTMSVHDLGGGDNVGALLDNITIDSWPPQGVPDAGATLLLFGMGLAGLAAFRRWRG